jgi:hypothetical protein
VRCGWPASLAAVQDWPASAHAAVAAGFDLHMASMPAPALGLCVHLCGLRVNVRAAVARRQPVGARFAVRFASGSGVLTPSANGMETHALELSSEGEMGGDGVRSMSAVWGASTSADGTEAAAAGAGAAAAAAAAAAGEEAPTSWELSCCHSDRKALGMAHVYMTVVRYLEGQEQSAGAMYSHAQGEGHEDGYYHDDYYDEDYGTAGYDGYDGYDDYGEAGDMTANGESLLVQQPQGGAMDKTEAKRLAKEQKKEEKQRQKEEKQRQKEEKQRRKELQKALKAGKPPPDPDSADDIRPPGDDDDIGPPDDDDDDLGPPDTPPPGDDWDGPPPFEDDAPQPFGDEEGQDQVGAVDGGSYEGDGDGGSAAAGHIPVAPAVDWTQYHTTDEDELVRRA